MAGIRRWSAQHVEQLVQCASCGFPSRPQLEELGQPGDVGWQQRRLQARLVRIDRLSPPAHTRKAT
ncbi:MAG TPA: hypothetical protein VJ739_13185, partial [Gemmataceae bacterium]|nr:hypothetical protein [Gemmataceae bacterium]